jgi:diguanylate cyclase (GGDEF)-like protein
MAIIALPETPPRAPADERTLSETDLLSALDALPMGVLLVQRAFGDVVLAYANRPFEESAGLARGEANGRALARVPLIGGSTEALADIAEAIGQPTPTDREWTLAAAPRDVSLLARITPLPGRPPRAIVALRDRSAEVAAERNLRQTMLHDTLTGLPNRLLFGEEVELAVERATARGHDVAVLLLNIDRFKAVNESLGHIAGDELLISVARRLLPHVGPGGMLARLSADEFAMLIDDVESPEAALTTGAEIRRMLAQPFAISGQDLYVSGSVGVATTRDSARFGDELIRDADFALHRAKRGTGVALYEAADMAAARARFLLGNDLRQALNKGELAVHYQPIVDLWNGRVAGFEALLRWNHPTRGAVPPADFIPIAEETGLIVPIGRWVLGEACRAMAEWKALLPDVGIVPRMGVNLSGAQLARDDIVAAVETALADSGLSGDCLKLELTESVIVDNPARAGEVLGALKALGVTIAMDDFGTGYSSLANLQLLPIDMLKIDRSFVGEMLTSPDSYKIVTAILSLAASLGLETVAEGVETPLLADKLTILGCDMGQGYFYAEALSPAAIPGWIAARPAPVVFTADPTRSSAT